MPAYAPTVIAHRCGTVYGPENITSTAIKAVRAGVTTLEIDIRCSKDNTPWLMHDWAVDRTTNGTGGIINLTDKQLLRCIADGTKGERIPTLYEFLRDVTAVAPNTKFVLHFQPGNWNPQGIKNIQNRLNNLRIPPDRIIFASWMAEHLEGFKRYANPASVRLQFLTQGSPLRISPHQTACMPDPATLTPETVAAAAADNNEIYGSASQTYWQKLIDLGIRTNMLNNPQEYWIWLGQRADGSL